MSSPSLESTRRHLSDFSGAYLTEPPEDFYYSLGQEIIPCCGYEFGSPDFHSALHLLNGRLKLQLDETDLQVFSLMLTGLSQARRFGGDLHISPLMGENSAAHSLHSVVLATEAFRRGTVLSPESQTLEVMQMRSEVSLCLLIHDMGEILGEISSLAQRAANSALEELPDVEREIFRIALTEAYRSVTEPDSSPARFYSVLRNMREEASIGQQADGGTDMARLLHTIEKYKRAQEHTPLPPAVASRIGRFLELYDIAELKDTRASKYDGFVGNFVKAIEHLQGLRHMLRFATTDKVDQRLHLTHQSPALSSPQGPWVAKNIQPMIPLRYQSDYRVQKNAYYSQSGLAALSSCAESPHEQLMARQVRTMVFQGMAEWLSVTRPVIDRTVRSEKPYVTELQSRMAATGDPLKKAGLSENLELFARIDLREQIKLVRDVRGDGYRPEELQRLETRRRLVGLYLKAIEVDFVPTSDTPLIYLETLPKELQGFHLIDYTKLLRQASARSRSTVTSIPEEV